MIKKFLFGFIPLLLIAMEGHSQFITNNGLAITNSTWVVTNGAWTNDAGTVILNNGTIRTTDNFINNGSLDVASKGGFELSFATNLTFQPGGYTFGYLRKEGAGVLELDNTFSLKDSLTLVGGSIRFADPTDSIALAQGAIVKAGSNAFIEGYLSQSGKGDFLFPLGRDGMALPLKLHKADVSKVTVSVIPAPAATAGPGVEALINFPYAWKVEEKNAADTATFVEISYPATLPVATDPIVVKTIGNRFASMGARAITNDGSKVTVKSYSRGLKGTFSIARGFPVDPVTDSLALVSLYDSASGNGWTNGSTWKTGPVENWTGVVRSGQTITSLLLSNNNLSGKVPQQLTDILGLEVIDLSDNNLTSIPDFTVNPRITSLDVSGNQLTFASLEPNANIAGFVYNNQALIGSPVDSLVEVGTPYTFHIDAGGEKSNYVWKRNNVIVDGSDSSKLVIDALNRSNMGEYTVEVTNTDLPQLTLQSEVQTVLAYANLSGKVLLDQSVPATKGDITLYKVQPGAFEPVQVVEIATDGAYAFNKVVLDDYQIRAFADTLVHEDALPTYYKNTIFWEEADTLFVEGHANDLNIGTETLTESLGGRGVIAGTLTEDDGTGRGNETQKPKVVKGAGVSARRVQNTGRGKEEVLELVAYVFTDENGEFDLSNLPEGLYKLNIQYPGYPMDETSDIYITIGSGLKSTALVEAEVKNNKIEVRKLIVTDIWQAEKYTADVFPNPTTEYINIKFGKSVPGRSVALTSASGKTVLKHSAETSEVKVNVQPFNKGLYILSITENNSVVKTLKVVIE